MAIAYDNVSPVTDTAAGGTSLTSTSWTIAGANRLLIGGALSGAGSPVTASGMKWGGSGGTALTQVGTSLSIPSFWNASAWRLIAPAAASQTLYASWGSSQDELVLGGASYTGVDQTTPITGVQQASGTNSASVTVSGLSVGDTVVALMYGGDASGSGTFTITPNAGTTRYTVPSSGTNFEAMKIVEYVASSSTQVCSFTNNGSSPESGVIAFKLNAAGGSPDVTVNLTGLAATSAAGTAGNTRSVAATGQSVTAATGTMTPAMILQLSGQAIAAATGALSLSRAVSLSGQSLTTSQGSLTPTLSITLTGLGATASPGSVVAAIAKALSGQAVAMSQGTITVGGNINITLTGQGVTAAVGILLPTRALPVTGLAATSAAGSINPARSLGVTGQSVAAAQGTLALTAALQLVGSALAAAAGIVTSGSNVTVTLTGQAMTAALGTLAPSHANALTGGSATGGTGTIATLRALALLGIPATVSDGTITAQQGANVTVQLSGLAAAMAVGQLGPAFGIQVIGITLPIMAGAITPDQPPAGSPTPNPSLSGAMASPNPFSTVVAGEAALRTGPGGCKIGRFAWADADGVVSNIRSNAIQLGFAAMQPQYWYGGYWSDGDLVLHPGCPISLLRYGDVWTRFEDGARPGAQVYADVLTGRAISGYSASGEPTPWYVVTNAAPGELAVISTTSRVN